MLRIFSIAGLIILLAHAVSADIEPDPYQDIAIKQIFSMLITRDKADRVYSGQIKNKAGLITFEKSYGINVDMSDINFKKQMLIFGITDNITTRAFQFLKQKRIRLFTLDYAETGIKYKLRAPGEGKKHSYIQVFALNNIEGIPHIQVKNRVGNGLSKLYDK